MTTALTAIIQGWSILRGSSFLKLAGDLKDLVAKLAATLGIEDLKMVEGSHDLSEILQLQIKSYYIVVQQ